MKRLIVFLSMALYTLAVLAQNVEFTASAPRTVQAGEQFQVTFSINASPSGFKPPVFKNFSFLGGPSTSSSSSIQIVNGRMSQTSTYTYTYFLQADNVGTFTLDGAKATVDGKNYMSNTLSIEVVKGQAGSGSGNTAKANQGGGSSTDDNTVVEAGNDDLFVRVLVDKTSVYQGEQVIASIKLFSRLNISAIENVEYPSFTGFFRQDIETQPLRALETETINGKQYGTGVIQKMVLFPQKNGQLVIDPFSLQCIVQQQVNRRSRSPFDDFFGPSYQEVRKKIKSKPVVINVKPLPGTQPANYKGAVGNFNFSATLDKNNVKSNDAITLKVVISGNGNLKMIEPFKINFPADFETYDPKVSVNSKASNGGVNGSISFEYLIIPRHSGNFKIPSIDFSYFDTQTKQFKTASSGEFEITVSKGADEDKNSVVTSVSQEDVRFIGKDISFIKTKLPEFKPKGDFLFGSYLFFFSYIISAILFFVWVAIWRKRIKDNSNVVKVKNRKANKVAQKRLNEAHQSLKQNNKELFYENVLKALWGYMGDKLSIPVSELSRDKILEETTNRNIDKELINKFLGIADTCEYARYAPGDSASQMDSVYQEAAFVISSLEQKIR